MEIFTLLETLKDVLDESKTVPFTNKCIVEKDNILGIIKEIIAKLPDELKRAKWITEDREKIIEEAQKDAEGIVKEAENRIISMIDEHEITKKAYEKKEEIIADANKMYRDITKETSTYADGILANVEESMQNLSKTLSSVESSLQSALETIKNNRKELK